MQSFETEREQRTHKLSSSACKGMRCEVVDERRQTHEWDFKWAGEKNKMIMAAFLGLKSSPYSP